MRPMRKPIALRRRRSHAAATALAAVACAAFASTTLAQDAADARIATVTAVVRDAAATALLSARNLTSSALDLIGIRYKWGGTTPESGLDCSGLVQFVFQQVTGVTLPRSTKDLSRIGSVVAQADLKPGDLVFFNTRRLAFSRWASTSATTGSFTRRGADAKSRSRRSTRVTGRSTSTARGAWSVCSPR